MGKTKKTLIESRKRASKETFGSGAFISLSIEDSRGNRLVNTRNKRMDEALSSLFDVLEFHLNVDIEKKLEERKRKRSNE